MLKETFTEAKKIREKIRKLNKELQDLTKAKEKILNEDTNINLHIVNSVRTYYGDTFDIDMNSEKEFVTNTLIPYLQEKVKEKITNLENEFDNL